MELKSICDRHPLASLRHWRLRLKQELQQTIAARKACESEDALARKQQDKELRRIKASYDALSLEIAAQNCRRQCELMERYKGERRGGLQLLKEMSSWCWRRY
jgi:hypothetical protein